MAKLNMSIPHRLSRDEALARIKGLLERLKQEYGNNISNLQESWNGNKGTFSFSAKGFNISGTLDVGTFAIRLSGNLPFAARFFKGRIEETIRTEARKLLG